MQKVRLVLLFHCRDTIDALDHKIRLTSEGKSLNNLNGSKDEKVSEILQTVATSFD